MAEAYLPKRFLAINTVLNNSSPLISPQKQNVTILIPVVIMLLTSIFEGKFLLFIFICVFHDTRIEQGCTKFVVMYARKC